MTTTDRRWLLLGTVSAALLLISLDNTVFYTALPTLIRELRASPAQSLWIINAYPLTMAGLLLGAGTLGDRVGHRKMFLGGLLLFGIASLFATFAPSAEFLIGARVLLAVGAASMMPATLALLRIAFVDERERSMAIAIWGSISIVGAALGPLIGGFLLQYFWWGSVFLINIPVVLVTLLSATLVTPRSTPDSSRPWDLLSSLQVLVALSGLVFSIKEAAHTPPSWPLASTAFVLSFIAGFLFVRRQSQLTYPLVDFSIFRTPAFLAGSLAATFAMFATAGVQLVATQRFQLVAGFSPMLSGSLVSVLAVGCLPSALLGGAFLHRLGLLSLIGGGLFLAPIGIVIMALQIHAHLTWTIAGLAITGIGLGAVMSVASSAIVGNAPAHRAGMASSIEEVSYEMGSLLAVALLGSLLATLYSTQIQLPSDAPEAARESLTTALDLALRGNSTDQELIQSASQAFDRSYQVVLLIIAAFLFSGALVISFLLRKHGPGSISFNSNSH